MLAGVGGHLRSAVAAAQRVCLHHLTDSVRAGEHALQRCVCGGGGGGGSACTRAWRGMRRGVVRPELGMMRVRGKQSV